MITLYLSKPLTQNQQQTAKDTRQGAHAQLDHLALLGDVTVLAQEARRTQTTVASPGLLVDADPAVSARTVHALIDVDAVVPVRSRESSLTTPAMRAVKGVRSMLLNFVLL